jgi:hypothetical protein
MRRGVSKDRKKIGNTCRTQVTKQCEKETSRIVRLCSSSRPNVKLQAVNTPSVMPSSRNLGRSDVVNRVIHLSNVDMLKKAL